jgi:sulfonate transport system permease protein
VSSSTTGVLARPQPAIEPAKALPRKRLRRPDLRRWISPVGIVLLWQLAGATGVLPSEKLSSPLTVLRTGIDLAKTGELGDALLISFGRAMTGFAIGAAIGIVLGIVSGLSRWGEALVDPPVQMLRTLPLFGLIPLLILWSGIGEQPKIILLVFGVAFPLYLNVHSGIRNVDSDLVEAATALGFTRLERLWHVVLPSAVPQTLVGVRQGLGIAWIALIVAEQFNANGGLGFMINNAREFLRTDIIVAGLVVYAILGLLTDALVRLLERRALRWRAS